MLKGSKKQVSRWAKAQGLEIQVVAQQLGRCVECNKAGGLFVRCCTPAGDGCGRRWCNGCSDGPEKTPTPEMFVSQWRLLTNSFLCSQQCASDVSDRQEGEIVTGDDANTQDEMLHQAGSEDVLEDVDLAEFSSEVWADSLTREESAAVWENMYWDVAEADREADAYDNDMNV